MLSKIHDDLDKFVSLQLDASLSVKPDASALVTHTGLHRSSARCPIKFDNLRVGGNYRVYLVGWFYRQKSSKWAWHVSVPGPLYIPVTPRSWRTLHENMLALTWPISNGALLNIPYTCKQPIRFNHYQSLDIRDRIIFRGTGYSDAWTVDRENPIRSLTIRPYIAHLMLSLDLIKKVV